MILHTIVDMNDIFASNNNVNYTYKNINNCLIEGEKTEDGLKINRIISTNLEDYLNPQYQLGQFINKK